MAAWAYPIEWMRQVPGLGSGDWHYTVYVDVDGLPQTVFRADPDLGVDFNAVRNEVSRALEATLGFVYPTNHPKPRNLDARVLCVRVTERGTSGGALGAPARLLTHSWRDLIAIGLHEARLPPDSVESD